jgi:protein-L-isoaspartate(D-aspartate) O-methyltransferase
MGRDAEQEARRRNDDLIRYLRTHGALHDDVVEGAFRRVLRHHFLPGHALADVYEDAAIPTRSDELGRPTSSSSQPAIMALMLEQLAVRPGQRVLEIGAGTGYNAAMLQVLVGEAGHVVTLDIEDEVCRRAAEHLAAAGACGVEVRCADGALGWPGGAPYDRIMLTVGSTDVAPAWLDQLRPDGRLVLPLGLGGPIQLSIAFRREGEGDHLTSDGISWCGFMPLRGAVPATVEPGAEEEPEVQSWLAAGALRSAVALPADEAARGFESWLALTEPSYVTLRTDPAEPPTFGLRDALGMAVATPRRGRIAVDLYGDAAPVAARLLAAYETWAQRRPRLDRLRVDAYRNPPPRAVTDHPGARLVRRRYCSFRLRWPA